MPDDMTNAQWDEVIDTIADLILAKAKTVEEAAAIVRERKTKKEKEQLPPDK